IELDVAPALDLADVAVAAGLEDARPDFLDLRVDVVDRAVSPALDLVADHRAHRHADIERARCVAPAFDVPPVAEAPIVVLVPERDAVAHVVEHELHRLARLLDIALGGRGLGLGGVQLALALARLGDVAGDPDHAARASVRAAHDD